MSNLHTQYHSFINYKLTAINILLENFSHKSLWGLEAIYRNGAVVGFVRRADYAFTLNKTIVHAYVSPDTDEKVTQSWLK